MIVQLSVRQQRNPVEYVKKRGWFSAYTYTAWPPQYFI